MDYHIDVKNKILGRVATEAAHILQGKKNPRYNPREIGRDRVIIANAKHIAVSGKKTTDKIYYRHTGYVGHLKEKRFEEAMAKDPRWVIRQAVRRMLPKNFLNARRMKRLIFKD